MNVINNRNNTYIHTHNKQENKNASISSSKILVETIQKIILKTKRVISCEQYEPNQSLRINKAPAVRLPNGKLVIAPDLKCKLDNNKIFWIEVKDKCQRFFKPDTGADLHQLLGFYQINNELNEPVLMIFKDASRDDCNVVTNKNKNIENNFIKRWELFNGEPYGEWLNNCLILDKRNKYPLVAFERSRKIPIFIFYFYINNLKKINFTILLVIFQKKKIAFK